MNATNFTDAAFFNTVCVLLIANIAMRAAVAVYYLDTMPVLRTLRLASRIAGPRESYYKKLDAWLAPFPFLWSWLDITIASMLAARIDHWAFWGLLVVWTGGRFRALQEFGHNAVHFALCKNKTWQWWLSDLFFQFPSFKRDMYARQIVHTKEHHRHPNDPKKDPNRIRVEGGGMSNSISTRRFYLNLLYPVSPRGLQENVATMLRNSCHNRSKLTVVFRLLSLGATGLLLYWAGSWKAVVFAWIVPLLTSYTLFAWWSLLAEHRWFVPEFSEDRRTNECIVGRPTDYRGMTGVIVRMLISPTSDAYHLAHSLYPGIRWNYLPAIDHCLKIEDPRYTQFASEGLLVSRNGVPSALSELRERLTGASAEI